MGTTEEHTVGELAEMVVRLSGKDIGISYDRSKPSGALSRKPDLNKAKQVLGWEPTTPFDKGLSKTYDWALSRV